MKAAVAPPLASKSAAGRLEEAALDEAGIVDLQGRGRVVGDDLPEVREIVDLEDPAALDPVAGFVEELFLGDDALADQVEAVAAEEERAATGEARAAGDVGVRRDDEAGGARRSAAAHHDRPVVHDLAVSRPSRAAGRVLDGQGAAWIDAERAARADLHAVDGDRPAQAHVRRRCPGGQNGREVVPREVERERQAGGRGLVEAPQRLGLGAGAAVPGRRHIR